MRSIVCYFSEPDWYDVVVVVVRIVFAALCGGLIGLERGRHGRAAGLRTHILICMGSAMTSLTGAYVVNTLGFGTDITRLSAQVISGIGFLGAGTILIRSNSIITGLTTAAGMWTTATIGIAIGFGFYIGAIAATIIGIFSVTVLSHLESRNRKEVHIYIELENIRYTAKVVDALVLLDDKLLYYEIIPPKSGHHEHVGIVCRLSSEQHFADLTKQICDKEIAMIVQI